MPLPRSPLALPTLLAAALVACGAQAPEVPQPFGSVRMRPAFVLTGAGRNVDSLAFFEADDPRRTLLLVTAKGNQLVEVWRFPFVETEAPPLRHESFAASQVNGVAVDQARRLLYLAVSEPASSVSVFSLPELRFERELLRGEPDLGGEPNLALLTLPDGTARLYVTADDVIHVLDPHSGEKLRSFEPERGVETLVADDRSQVLYVPDENDRSGIYAYQPDGTRYRRHGATHFGEGRFQADAEGIVLYRCPGARGADDGAGWLVVADQRREATELEFFDRERWVHLGALILEGVSNTDGVGSTQRALPGYPLGLLAVIDDDARTAVVGWDAVLQATGLACPGAAGATR